MRKGFFIARWGKPFPVKSACRLKPSCFFPTNYGGARYMKDICRWLAQASHGRPQPLVEPRKSFRRHCHLFRLVFRFSWMRRRFSNRYRAFGRPSCVRWRVGSACGYGPLFHRRAEVGLVTRRGSSQTIRVTRSEPSTRYQKLGPKPGKLARAFLRWDEQFFAE